MSAGSRGDAPTGPAAPDTAPDPALDPTPEPRPAERPPASLRLALVGLVVAALLAVLPGGLPRAERRSGAWRGVGAWISERLPNGGELTHEQFFRDRKGRDGSLTAVSYFGLELAWCLGYALVFAGAAWALARRVPDLRVLPDASDVRRALHTIAWLIPLFALGGLAAALVAAEVDDGLGLRRAVYTFVLPSLGQPGPAVWTVLRLVLLAPLAEELLWRGLIHTGLRTRLPPAPAAVVGALAFAGWHLLAGWAQPVALVPQYGFALLACWWVERTGSLGVPLLLHAAGNAAAVGLYLLCMHWPRELLALLGA